MKVKKKQLKSFIGIEDFNDLKPDEKLVSLYDLYKKLGDKSLFFAYAKNIIIELLPKAHDDYAMMQLLQISSGKLAKKIKKRLIQIYQNIEHAKEVKACFEKVCAHDLELSNKTRRSLRAVIMSRVVKICQNVNTYDEAKDIMVPFAFYEGIKNVATETFRQMIQSVTLKNMPEWFKEAASQKKGIPELDWPNLGQEILDKSLELYLKA